MQAIAEQRELANEIADAISDPMNSGIDLDEARLFGLVLHPTRLLI